ncbi:MAG: D-ribose transporter ATP-binding protein, partial [Pseudonocardiales bacterium]|nr:D-ribose transporter ATP-binding protein [Pseudonocardiales bacterium]
MGGAEPVLTLRGVSKAYGSFAAVSDVDLDVYPGEVIGLVGKNGAGKSTLIKSLTGVVRRDAGAVQLHGEEVDFDSPAAAHQAGIGVVHQELSAIPGLTVAENVMLSVGFPRHARTLIDRGALRRAAKGVLRRVGLGEMDPNSLVDDLSPVQLRLVMIASALAHDVSILILDEPTASFADREVELLHQVMADLSGRGTAIVFVSHRLDEVLALCDRVVTMRDSRV